MKRKLLSTYLSFPSSERIRQPWRLRKEKMKDIDLGKEYVIPSPGYRNVRERNSLEQLEEQDGVKCWQERNKVSKRSLPHFLFQAVVAASRIT
ncbi:UNVERIFIED_CONTAM: hypothetical protein K2H54_062582 [Gekko kuhli]